MPHLPPLSQPLINHFCANSSQAVSRVQGTGTLSTLLVGFPVLPIGQGHATSGRQEGTGLWCQAQKLNPNLAHKSDWAVMCSNFVTSSGRCPWGSLGAPAHKREFAHATSAPQRGALQQLCNSWGFVLRCLTGTQKALLTPISFLVQLRPTEWQETRLIKKERMMKSTAPHWHS